MHVQRLPYLQRGDLGNRPATVLGQPGLLPLHGRVVTLRTQREQQHHVGLHRLVAVEHRLDQGAGGIRSLHLQLILRADDAQPTFRDRTAQAAQQRPLLVQPAPGQIELALALGQVHQRQPLQATRMQHGIIALLQHRLQQCGSRL